jgi:hypothetical protein
MYYLLFKYFYLVFTLCSFEFQKKHSAHAITSDVDIGETAKAAKFFSTDGVIITGSATGSPASKTELEQVLDAVQDRDPEAEGLPVLIGSGIDPDNVSDFKRANAFIVGSYFKEGGRWQNRIDEHRVEKLLKAVQSFRT